MIRVNNANLTSLNNMTIREMVATIQKELRETELLPMRAAEILNQLSSLLGNVNDEVTQRQMDYNLYLFGISEDKTVSKARLLGETSDLFRDLLTAKATKELVESMIGSLKYYLRSKEHEYREAKYS